MTSDQIYIRTAADARKCLNQIVYWDDVGNRYIFLRSGLLTEYFNRNVCVDGDFKFMRDFPGLRNFSLGGAWAKNKGAT